VPQGVCGEAQGLAGLAGPAEHDPLGARGEESGLVGRVTDAEYEIGEKDGVGGETRSHFLVTDGLLDEVGAFPSQS